MAREELKWQNIHADDLPAAVKKSFDAMDHQPPLSFLEMLALPGQLIKRDADVKQIAVRMIVPV